MDKKLYHLLLTRRVKIVHHAYMIHLTIDGKTVEAHDGETLLDAAARGGIRIPTLCYKKETPEPSVCCMICVVKETTTARMLPACATKVAEGMAIETSTEEVRDHRRRSMQLLNVKKGVCIACGNCVRMSRAMNEPVGLAWHGRGATTTIAPPLGREGEELLTNSKDACVRVCPTGAVEKLGIRN